jgi:hypothetical protein
MDLTRPEYLTWIEDRLSAEFSAFAEEISMVEPRTHWYVDVIKSVHYVVSVLLVFEPERNQEFEALVVDARLGFDKPRTWGVDLAYHGRPISDLTLPPLEDDAETEAAVRSIDAIATWLRSVMPQVLVEIRGHGLWRT